MIRFLKGLFEKGARLCRRPAAAASPYRMPWRQLGIWVARCAAAGRGDTAALPSFQTGSKRHWWWLLLVPLALGLSRVQFDTEVLNLLPDDVAEVQGLKLYQRHFTDNRELLVTIRGTNAAVAESAARAIAAHLGSKTNLAASVTWQPPWQEHPEQMAELVACLWLNQPPAHFAELTNRLAPGRLDALLADAREQLTTSLSPMALGRLGYDPFGLTQLPGQDALSSMAPGESGDWFTSPDGTLRVVYVEAPELSGSYIAMRHWLKSIQEEISKCGTRSEWESPVTVRYTGAPAFVSEISTGMERDMRNSVAAGILIVAALFWWAHRSWRPLLWIGFFLGVIIVGTLAAGGLIWGRINAVSTGFAAILLGLAVDYALVLYQEAVVSPGHTAKDIRRLLAPSLGWSAVTTACAFGLLMFAGLPGLAQLGSLIAIGILLAAVVMLYGFLPVMLRGRVGATPEKSAPTPAVQAFTKRRPVGVVVFSLVLAMAALGVWLVKGSRVDHGSGSLQPINCEAQAALDELDREMNRQGKPALILVAGKDEAAVARRLDQLEDQLKAAQKAGEIHGFALPTGLWPHPERAQSNLVAAAALFPQLETMRAAVELAGFTPDALALTENIFSFWKSRESMRAPLWPTNRSSQWILRRAAAPANGQWLAAGMVLARTDTPLPTAIQQLHQQDDHLWITGWPQLAEALLQHIEARLGWLVVTMLVLVTTCLWLAFRRWSEVLLSFATLAFSLLMLLGVMALADWSWNLMSLMAIPLLLGAGVDYTIHIQLAMRRHMGDASAVRRTTGRAVLLCAATTIAGFGSNALSSNAGMVALGSVCAVGITLVYLSSAYLLPAWWTMLHAGEWNAPVSSAAGPSVIYQPRLWSLGLGIARLLPERFATWLGRTGVSLYAALHPSRRAVVAQNLLPLCDDNPTVARQLSRRLFANFGAKVAQLLRREAGVSDAEQLARWSGWETFSAAQATGRGVLLVTPHLGDWELGGDMLARRGVRLLVLTQPEPGAGFTELRRRSRLRSGIETIVVGQDSFAFVEVIKHLQEGAVVALLVDRPPPPTGVTVELFGRPFHASIAAAELARTTGCVVLPVYVVQDALGVSAQVLPEVSYDRRELGDREARRQMTQRMMRAFEPVIKEYADQWYHFVPVWPEKKE